MGKKYKVNYDASENGDNGKGFNYVFLLIFFGIVILIQVIGIIMRNFQAGVGQLIGIGIGLAGYGLILNAYMKEKKRKKK